MKPVQNSAVNSVGSQSISQFICPLVPPDVIISKVIETSSILL